VTPVHKTGVGLVVLAILTSIGASAYVPLLFEGVYGDKMDDIGIVDFTPSPLDRVPEAVREKLVFTCMEYNIPLEYFINMVEWESGFDPEKMSGTNTNGSYDIGLVQVNSKYVKYFGWKYNIEGFCPSNVNDALEFAGKHLAFLYDQTGDWKLTFASYNAGLERVLSGDIPASTIEYVDIIFGRM